MEYLDIPPDYVRILARKLLKQPRKGIQEAYKGSAIDLAVICDNLSKLPASLHAKIMDMFISHLDVPLDGSELPSEKLKNMDQALRGIYTLIVSGHSGSTSATNCSCQHILSMKWARILDCAEFILHFDSSNSCLSHEHLEKQCSAVFHTATRNQNLVKHIYDSLGKKTVDIVSRLLLRQDKRAGWPWSNEEAVVSLYRYKCDGEILSTFVKATGDDSYQITETLTERYRLVSKEGVTMQSIKRMEPLLFLIAVVINEYGFKPRAKDNMNKVVVVAKSLSALADTLTSLGNREDKRLRFLAAQTIVNGLLMYCSLFGYQCISLAIQVVRLGLFDVILAVNPVLTEMKNQGSDVGQMLDFMSALLSRVLPELLIYGSFVNAVVTAVRPLARDERLPALWQGLFGDAWSRFDRILLERFAVKKVHHAETKRYSADGVCQNDDCETSDFTHNFKKCGTCMNTRYCSTECQKAHWKSHKLTCERPNLEDGSKAVKRHQKYIRDKNLLAIMTMADIKRHLESIRKHASTKYPGVAFEDMCIVVEYIQTQATPNIEIQAVPIEETQWSQHLGSDAVEKHYERIRMGRDSCLILIQNGFTYPNPDSFHHFSKLEDKGKATGHMLPENLRTAAFDPDGTRLQNALDTVDIILEALHSFRMRTAENSWICNVRRANDVVQLDIFEAIEEQCRQIQGV